MRADYYVEWFSRYLLVFDLLRIEGNGFQVIDGIQFVEYCMEWFSKCILAFDFLRSVCQAECGMIAEHCCC